MKKCPEKEILMAYVDGELEGEELAGLRAHLNDCKSCSEEVSACAADAAVIKAGFDELFSRHRVSEKIMSQVRKTVPAAVEVVAARPAVPLWKRLLIPALGLTLLFVALMLMWPANSRYHGTQNSISYHALNDNSTVNGVVVSREQMFTVKPCEKQLLSGIFLFSSLESPSEISMQGSAMISVSDNCVLQLTDARVELNLMKGSGFQLVVNDENVFLRAGSVTYKNFALPEPVATETAAIASEAIVVASSAAITSVVASETAAVMIASHVHNEAVAIASETVNASTAVPVSAIEINEPASGVEPITNPFVDKPLGQGQ